MLDIKGILEVLEGKVRGKPVAITLFPDSIPESYKGVKVDPCGILRYAMDEEKIVYFDREHQDCLHGAYITGVHEGNEQIRSGRLLTDYIPVYNIDAAYKFNSGQYILPQGTVKAIGAAPLDKIPAGINVDWLAMVCTPFWAGQIAACRSIKDGVQPDAAAGNSFCTDLFVSPWYHDNVVMTPGDMGGRMNNKLKPEEMFVIIPKAYANNLIQLLGETPDVKGIFEATRPDDSVYWQKKANKEKRAQERTDQSSRIAKEKYKLSISMEWDEDALDMISKAPRFVRKFAVGNVEDFADEQGYQRITVAVVKEQADSVGMGKFVRMWKGRDKKAESVD